MIFFGKVGGSRGVLKLTKHFPENNFLVCGGGRWGNFILEKKLAMSTHLVDRCYAG